MTKIATIPFGDGALLAGAAPANHNILARNDSFISGLAGYASGSFLVWNGTQFVDSSTIPFVWLGTFTVDTAPSAGYGIGICTDGNSGSPCLAVCYGYSWKRVALGATISKT